MGTPGAADRQVMVTGRSRPKAAEGVSRDRSFNKGKVDTQLASRLLSVTMEANSTYTDELGLKPIPSWNPCGRALLALC
jgi:hypothetical protein